MSVTAIAAIFVVSCTKELPEPSATNPANANNNSGGSNPKDPQTLTPWGLNWTWDAVAEDCVTPAKDCFDEVVIDGSSGYLSDFEDAIAGGAQDIADFFLDENQWPNLFPGLTKSPNDSHLSALQSGNYYIVQVGTQDARRYKVLATGINALLCVLRINTI